MNNISVLLTQFANTTAEDLRLLADLHAQELDANKCKTLVECQFPQNLGLVAATFEAETIQKQLYELVCSWSNTLDQAFFDELASDYAAIYLNGAYHACPQESVWIDDEGLVCQQPMFQVRDCYAEYGLKAPDWRQRSDDHLVNELLFIAHVLEQAGIDADKKHFFKLAIFLDEHLLRWLTPFSQRVANRCDTAFYAHLNLLTADYCEQIRDLIAEILEQARPSREEIEARLLEAQRAKHQVPAEPLQYMPGVAPSW